MKTPNLASVNHCGVGRESIDSQFGRYLCFPAAVCVCSKKPSKHKIHTFLFMFVLHTEILTRTTDVDLLGYMSYIVELYKADKNIGNNFSALVHQHGPNDLDGSI